MASKAAASSSFSSSSSPVDPNNCIDLIELFNTSPTPSFFSAFFSSVAVQQITLSCVPYNVKLSLNAKRQSELLFEAADQGKLSSAPESWKFGGSAEVGADTLCCCFSADSKYFITGGRFPDNKIRLWNPSTRSLVATLSGHTSYVNSLISFTLNYGKMMLVSGSDDSTIRIWEWNDPAAAASASASASSSPLSVATLQADSIVFALAYCSKQNALISGQRNGSTIKFWSASNWKCMQTLSSSSDVYALSLSCDESKLASGHQDGSIHIWDMSTRTQIKTWTAAAGKITANGLCFSPCQPDILVAASCDGTCATWNCATGSKIGSISTPSLSLFLLLSLPASFSLNGNYFVTVSDSYQLILVDSKTSNVIRIMDGCPSSISSACFSPDGKFLACATRDRNKSFYMWESPPVASPVLPEPSSDFRLVALSDSTGLAVVRLSSSKWAVSTVASSPTTRITVSEWTLVPNSMPHPTVRILPIDGITLKIEDKNPNPYSRSTVVPIFIGKNANLLFESYSSAAQLTALIEAKERHLATQVALVKEEAARSKREAAASIDAKEKELAAHAALEVAKLQSYLIKQETGMDEALLELSFGNLSDPSCANRCKSILERHLSVSMSELRSIHSLAASSWSSGKQEEEEIASDAIDWKLLSIQREIGDGGFGSVFACELTLPDGTKRPVAMKVPARMARVTLSPAVPAPAAAAAEVDPSSKCIQNEIATFKRIEHPNVVRYIGFTVEPSPSSPTCMVLQYCAGGSLQQLLDSRQVCNDEKIAFQLAMQIASGMSAVHCPGVAHRDLKPANVLLCPLAELSVTVAKITDCGSANLKDLNAEQSRMTGVTSINGLTSRYCAPELLDDDLLKKWESSYAQDLWAFGLLLFQLRTGKAPFEKSSERTVIGHILTGKPPGVWPQENEQQWDWLRTLAAQCLEVQPADRLAHFEAMGASADGRTAFSAIEQNLREARPEWAKEVMANMLKFQRMEIRDPFLKDQIDNV